MTLSWSTKKSFRPSCSSQVLPWWAMVSSEGKRLLCLGKQLNYVWSVSELDKKKKLRSKKRAGIRGWIQAAATLLTNPHIPNFFQGKIYQGKAKTVCVPGLNCYSCPAATGACPIGAFQAVVGSSKFKFSYYITGFLILLGVTLGRFIWIWPKNSSWPWQKKSNIR